MSRRIGVPVNKQMGGQEEQLSAIQRNAERPGALESCHPAVTMKMDIDQGPSVDLKAVAMGGSR